MCASSSRSVSDHASAMTEEREEVREMRVVVDMWRSILGVGTPATFGDNLGERRARRRCAKAERGLCGSEGSGEPNAQKAQVQTMNPMSYELVRAANIFFAVLALSAAAGAVAVLMSKRLRRAMDPQTALMLVAAVAVTMMGGSLFYSEIVGYLPCKLCWVQRGFAYPGAIWASVATARRRVNQWWAGAVVGFGGLCISIWHYLIQNFPQLEGPGACDPNNPCSAAWMDTFGFVTIPFMAGCGFLAIGVLSALVMRKSRDEDGAAPEADAGA